jgi:hypothetical protein
MRLARLASVAAVLAMLISCAGPEEAVQKPVAPPAPAPIAKPEPEPEPKRPSPEALRMTELDGILSDFERLRRLSPAELAREQESSRQAFSQMRTDATRIRYAMALGAPGATGGENTALELLDPLVKNPNVSLHGIAVLLAAYIQEQRRLTSQLQGLQQQTQGLQQNVQALQQKLDALRTLERSLTEREAATPKPKPPPK